MNQNGLARYFHKVGEKFQASAQLVAIEIVRRNSVKVSHHPAHLVHIAVAPKQTTYLPDITVRTAMRASTQIASPAQRKLQHIVGNIHQCHPITGIEP